MLKNNGNREKVNLRRKNKEKTAPLNKKIQCNHQEKVRGIRERTNSRLKPQILRNQPPDIE